MKHWHWPVIVWALTDFWTDVPLAARRGIEVGAAAFALCMWFAETWLPLIWAWTSAALFLASLFGLFAYYRVRGLKPGDAGMVVLILALIWMWIRMPRLGTAVTGSSSTS